jgi:prevent-host-death family protein
MKTINIIEVAPQLNEIIKVTEQGESVLITINGTPVFRAIPVPAGTPPVPDDIKTPFAEEIEEMFYGKTDAKQPK